MDKKFYFWCCQFNSKVRGLNSINGTELGLMFREIPDGKTIGDSDVYHYINFYNGLECVMPHINLLYPAFHTQLTLKNAIAQILGHDAEQY